MSCCTFSPLSPWEAGWNAGKYWGWDDSQHNRPFYPSVEAHFDMSEGNDYSFYYGFFAGYNHAYTLSEDEKALEQKRIKRNEEIDKEIKQQNIRYFLLLCSCIAWIIFWVWFCETYLFDFLEI